jgi:hypothetical protein
LRRARATLTCCGSRFDGLHEIPPAPCQPLRVPLPAAGCPRWPNSLSPLINARTARFKTELIRSLQTTDSRTAERKVLSYIAEAHALADQARQFARSGPPADNAPDQVAALVREHETDRRAESGASISPTRARIRASRPHRPLGASRSILN